MRRQTIGTNEVMAIFGWKTKGAVYEAVRNGHIPANDISMGRRRYWSIDKFEEATGLSLEDYRHSPTSVS